MDFKRYIQFTRELQHAGFLSVPVIYKSLDGLSIEEAIENFVPHERRSIDYKHIDNQSLLEVRPIDNGVHLSYVHGGKELGVGNGTKAMQTLIKLCDKHGYDIELQTYSRDSIIDEAKGLFEFYRKLGFCIHQIDGWEDVVTEADLVDSDHLEGVPMKRSPNIA